MRHSLLLSLFIFFVTAVNAQVTMNIDGTKRGPLTSPYQYGLFFEEINHAGEGGLYAELVKNRAFDEGTDGWTAIGNANLNLVNSRLLNASRRQAMTVDVQGASSTAPKGVSNGGFWGMAFHKDSTYTLTVWLKGNNALINHLQARLIADDGVTVVGTADITGSLNASTYTKHVVTIKATGDADRGSLQILSTAGGSLNLGFVSLFPYTWNGRKNGLRPDLAQLLYDTKPTFLRFPGGCYVEGDTNFDNAFQWKKTIGPIEERPGHLNRNWGYWSSDGLGFDEYLQLCEDLGAAPLFVVNVGLGHGFYIPLEQVDTLVQNTLDAIEYANGDASTKWGAKRIANGHPAPYNLKFIEIGNENYNFNMNSNSDQSYQYPERYKKFYDAIKAKYPEITTIGNVEAWGTDNPSWRNDNPVEIVDEHYYRTFEWMRENYHKYDNRSRDIKVYNGEYAANGANWGRYGNMNSALGEAVYMLGMEKNSDVCVMGSFAPIFTHESNALWAYDMIHFNAAHHFVTPSYYVQKLFGHNLGTQNLTWTESNNEIAENKDMKVGVATWNTQVEFDDASVTDANGKVLASDDFANGTAKWNLGSGNWSVVDGALQQAASGTDHRAVLNVNLDGDYIYKVRARKLSGNEGFLIMFNVKDDNNYYWWNLGGWNNTRHGVEHAIGGAKTTVASANGNIETGRWYDIEIRVIGGQVTCLLDGTQIHQFTAANDQAIYQSVQLDSINNELIVKLVNPNSSASTVKLNYTRMTIGNGTVERLSSANGTDENTMDNPSAVQPTGRVSADIVSTTAATATAPASVTLNAPAYSLSIYRFPVSNLGEEVKDEYPQEYTDEDADKAGYLFAHMSNKAEITNYALSKYGNTFNDLLNGDEVFDTKAVTTTGGMRDAFVYRLHDNSGFMLVGTDMTSRLGWTSNHIMDLMISPDLVHWTKEVKIDLESADNLKALGGITADDMKAAWAPQVIYDPETEKYVLYYTVGFPDRHRGYYQLIDKDLNILSEPKLYFDPDLDVIDEDIVYNAKTKQYMMVYKDEHNGGGLYRATADHLVPRAGEETGTTVWTVTDGWKVDGFEAPTQWRPIGSDKWNLSYVQSNSIYTCSLDAEGLNPGSSTRMSGNVNPQHGSMLKLTEAEYQYLLDWEQVKELLPQAQQYYANSNLESIGNAVKLGEDALNNSTTFAENAAAMAAARKALEATPEEFENYYKSTLDKGKETDITALLINPDFSQRSTGWTHTGNFTNADGNVAEYWNNNTFDFHQTVTNLPKGNYEVTVQSFYRYGGWEGYNYHQDGSEQLLAELYANDASVPILSLYDDDMTASGGYTASPYTYPNNVTEANIAFNSDGLYKNTLTLTLNEPGDITLGIRKNQAMNNDWCIWDNFTLRYLGDPTGINSVKADENSSNSRYANNYYNLQGQRVNGKLQPGIYIHGGKKVIKK